jgi:hypothetical protein
MIFKEGPACKTTFDIDVGGVAEKRQGQGEPVS